MADGTTKPISDVEPGDQVLATDPATGETSIQTVLAVWVHEDTLMGLQVLLPGQPTPGSLEELPSTTFASIATTSDHPFWNHTDQQWQDAEDLTRGDHLLAPSGDGTVVVGLLQGQAEGLAYNLTIAGIHTYYVIAGNTPVLVHNCPDGVSQSRGSTGRTTPGGANEQRALDLVKENAQYGEVLPLTMRDPRWPADDGWVKMTQTVDGVEIHYVYNFRTGKADDFKFKDRIY